MSDEIVDRQLILKALKGNKYAFDALVLKYQYRICNVVARYVSDQSEAYDVTQETFIKVYKSLDKYRGDSTFYTWLYRIAINTAKNYIISHNKKIKFLNSEIKDFEEYINLRKINDEDVPDHVLFAEEVEEIILSVVNKLPVDLKTTLMLRDLDGRTYDEIASIMNCPIGTVRSRIYRARETIGRNVEPYLSKIG